MLGTAGHIDHGKTALVRRLTGCETDHLKEEIERGMSIELGVAPCMVSGTEIGIVDVPGHERFIKKMVAGATGMDGVIFLVAADDGIMPQTREHLDILTLLGIRHGIIALTKIDRVPPERISQVEAEVVTMLRGTFLGGAPILPISNITGEGFDGFLKALQDLVKSIRPKPVDGIFRLPVRKAFSIKGQGTVITGIPVSGMVKVGDEVVLLPQDISGRISGLQVYGKTAEQVLAGQSAALRIRHLEAKRIDRGNALAVPGYFKPEQWFVCALRLLPHETFFLKNAARIKLHTGTSEAIGKVYLFRGERLAAGEEDLVQVRVDEPIIAGPGDRFIVRTDSPPVTVGGGMIVEATPVRLKRNLPEVYEDLQKRAKAVPDTKTFIEYSLRTAPSMAAGEAELAFRTKTPVERAREVLKELTAAGQAIPLAANVFVHRTIAEQITKQIESCLAEYHAATPQSAGMALDRLLEATALPKPVLEGMLIVLKASGRLADRGGLIALPQHQPAYAGPEQEAMKRIEALFRERLFSPPGQSETASEANVPAALATKAVRLLVEQKRLVQVPPDLLFHAEAMEQARAILTDTIRKEGCMESVEFKYLLNTTRKFAIPLLDYFDRIGVTRAVGHTRYLRVQRPQA
jgi:selenocysteine-specific elongation factor